MFVLMLSDNVRMLLKMLLNRSLSKRCVHSLNAHCMHIIDSDVYSLPAVTSGIVCKNTITLSGLVH